MTSVFTRGRLALITALAILAGLVATLAPAAAPVDNAGQVPVEQQLLHGAVWVTDPATLAMLNEGLPAKPEAASGAGVSLVAPANAAEGASRLYNVGINGITVCHNWTTAYGDGVNQAGTCGSGECWVTPGQNSYGACGWLDTDGAFETSGTALFLRYHAGYSTPWQRVCAGAGYGWCKISDSPTAGWDIKKVYGY